MQDALGGQAEGSAMQKVPGSWCSGQQELPGPCLPPAEHLAAADKGEVGVYGVTATAGGKWEQMLP